jgi:hypothetical protein
LAGIAVLGAKIFDASRPELGFSVKPVIFQPANLSRDRIEKPIALSDLSDDYVRNNLIRKFAHEYFDILPDTGDMVRRRRTDSALARMSDEALFKEWDQKFASDMEKLALQNIMRRIVVRDISKPAGSEYFLVKYDVLTWDVANDITRDPQAETDKTMFIRLNFEKNVRQRLSNGKKFDVKKHLESGADPATIFRFKVLEVEHR